MMQYARKTGAAERGQRKSGFLLAEAMQADNALSHLYDGEVCVLVMRGGGQRLARWNAAEWRFFYADTPEAEAGSFDDIEEWRPASIRAPT